MTKEVKMNVEWLRRTQGRRVPMQLTSFAIVARAWRRWGVMHRCVKPRYCDGNVDAWASRAKLCITRTSPGNVEEVAIGYHAPLFSEVWHSRGEM